MDIKKVFSLLKKDLEKIERTFKKFTVSEVKLATKISEYVLFSGGKRVRPAIFLLCAKLCGCEDENIYPISCAIELLHTATLLHDDVIDDANLRRGKKSAKAVWNNKASILAGDFLNARVLRVFLDTKNLELVDLFSNTTLNLINGEIFQLTKEKDIKITEDDYYYIVKNKTAVLMSAAACMGAILAKKEKREIETLKSFGMNLGMAFQIVDDALDYAADESKLGKGLLADLKQGKITLPIIHILKNGSKQDKNIISKVILQEEHTANDIKNVYGLIKKYGSIDYVRDVAEKFINDAVSKLKYFPDSREKDALLSVSDFTIKRAY